MDEFVERIEKLGGIRVCFDVLGNKKDYEDVLVKQVEDLLTDTQTAYELRLNKYDKMWILLRFLPICITVMYMAVKKMTNSK